MSEHERYEQVGRLVEEYSRLKGEIAHLQEKFNRTQNAYTQMGPIINQLGFKDGEIHITNPLQGRAFPLPHFADLLNASELRALIQEKTRLHGELDEAYRRLKGLAPHLLT